MKKVLFAALAAALTLVACNKQESVRSTQPGEVKFTTNIQTYTVKATDTAFENNDKVGIFAGDPINKSNVEAVVSGTSLLPVTPIKWVEGNSNLVKFYAYYPYDAAAVKAYPFAVKANQGAEASYKASDLMLAATSSAPVETAVALSFSHVLSKVTVNITNNIPEATITKVEFEDIALGATVDLETGAISNVATELGTITANAVSATSFQLITVPQSATPKIRVTLSNGKAYLYELASAFTFKSGKKATAALVVNPQQEAGSVEFTLEVNDWDTDTDELGFGEPSVEEAAEVWKVMGLGEDWTDGLAMTENEYGDFEADITYAEGDSFKLKLGETWVGMQSTWEFYGLGDFGNDTNYLSSSNESKNIVLQAAGEYHLYFDPENFWFVVTRIGEDPAPETVTLTLNVYNSSNWESLNVYIYGTSELCGSWPGKAPEATDVVVGGNTFKSFVIEGLPKASTSEYYIINNGNGGAGNQSPDLNLPAFDAATATMYVELKANYTVSVIEDPENFDPSVIDPSVIVWAIVGIQNDWTNGIAMTPVAGDENSVEAQFNYDSLESNFKFKVYGEEWNNNYYGPADGNNLNYDLSVEYVTLALGANGNIFLPAVGDYKATLTIAGENAGRLKIVAIE